jgi:hypothetical protein
MKVLAIENTRPTSFDSFPEFPCGAVVNDLLSGIQGIS